jgi:hypothetical protein
LQHDKTDKETGMSKTMVTPEGVEVDVTDDSADESGIHPVGKGYWADRDSHEGRRRIEARKTGCSELAFSLGN